MKKRGCMALIAALYLGLGGTGSRASEAQLAAHEPSQISESHGAWTVKCMARQKEVPPCEMVQVGTNNQTREQVMRFSLAHAGDREEYGVQILVPLGVLLSGGVLVRVDDREDVKDFKFTRCEPEGCYIEALVDAKTLAPLRRGAKGVLAVLDRQGKPLVMPLSFDGFVAALETMVARNQMWAKEQRT